MAGLSQVESVEVRRLEPSDASASLERKRVLESELNRYLHLLVEHGDPEQVIVFGSMASGEIGPWSDIDLVIVEQTSLPFLKRLRRVRKLLKPRVGTDILAKGVVLYERPR